MYIAKRCPAQAYCSRHIHNAALHEHHVRRIYGNVSTRTYGYTGIRAGKRRGVVYAVAYHGDLALLHKAAYHSILAIRQHSGYNLIYSRLPAYCLGGLFVVACEHYYPYAHIAKLLHSLRAVLLYDVRHGDNSQQLIPKAEHQRRLALIRQPFRLSHHVLGHAHKAGYKAHAAAKQLFVSYGAFETVAGKYAEVRYVRYVNIVLLCLGHYGSCERVFALCFKSRRKTEELVFGYARPGQYIRHPGFPLGYSACLVEGNYLHPSRFLQRGSRLEQYSVLCSHAVAYHYGHWCGEAQCAGTAYDQHGYAPRKRKAHLTAQEQPYRRRHRRYGHYHRHEYAGDLIGHFCNRRLCGGGVAHHGNYLRERCILAHAGSPAAYVSRNIARCCGNAVPNIFVHRYAFACKRSLVHGAGALLNHAVYGDILARAHSEYISLLHLLYRDHDLLAVFYKHCGLGSQPDEAPQRVGSLALGTCLKCLAHGNQSEYHRGGLEVKLHHIVHDQLLIALYLRISHGKERIGAVHECRRSAQ